MTNIITSTLQRIAARVRRVRLAIAERDLAWMETVGAMRLAERRAHVADLRAQVVRDTVRISTEQIVARSEAALKRYLLEKGGR